MNEGTDTPAVRLGLVSNALGFGGTERGLATLAAALDPGRVAVRVVGARESGPIAEELRERGLDVACADGDAARLTGLLEGLDVVLVSRAGSAEPLVPAACRAAGVGSIAEWSIFGTVDRSADEAAFAAHLFISRMCWLRHRDAVAGGPRYGERHRVLYLPLDHAELRRLAPPRDAACRALGLDPSRPVVARIGRAADLKWRDLLVDMAPRLLELAPATQIVFVGATERKRARLARLGVLDRCVLLEPSPDRERLATCLAAADVTINAATIGESLGLAIAESMALGVPVVTCSTPWADNAQIELVEHGTTGLVANHPAPFGEAVAALLADPDWRRDLGARAQARVVETLDPARIARQVERLATSLAAGGGLPDEWEPSVADCEAFASEYAQRCALEYRPLSGREQVEAAAARGRERAERTAAALRTWRAAARRPPAAAGPPAPPAAALGPGSVSGVVVARNEEAVIERCLRSLDGVVDEIVLVHDGPCEDRTLQIAAAHGVRVDVRPALGNPEAQTVHGYELARGEWLLNIDADEFLSEDLRAALPDLVAREDVNGYEFVWPLWNGTRYTSVAGPHKLALSRRSATHLLGMLQSVEQVDPPVQRTDLLLEHRPRYNNFTARTMRTKWTRWARIHATELLGPFEAIPAFNWTGERRWPWYRPVLNSLSPIMVLALPPVMFLRFAWQSRATLSARENVRVSALLAIYVALVQVEVARLKYGRGG